MECTCRVCDGPLVPFVDLGRQPTANGFLTREAAEHEFFFQLVVGVCETCMMVQLTEEVPQELRYHADYAYHASGSATHRAHFEADAHRFLEQELTGADPFIVEIGCNDGVMLSTIAAAGVRHLGVEPSGGVADIARQKGVQVRSAFFDEQTARDVLHENGPADVIFGANTICHIAHIGSVLRGIDALLSDTGVFVFEEPYLATIVEQMAFDQIYDEHVFYFSATSVQNMARLYGLELVDVEPIAMHGGEIRYTLARAGARRPKTAVADLLATEEADKLSEMETFAQFGRNVDRIKAELVQLLETLRDEGRTVVGYSAPGKCSTVTNLCGIGPDLLPWVCDSTPAKQGLLVPGSHLPVVAPDRFQAPYPDYAVLFAWNHAREITAKEQAFRDSGGRWIRYVPTVEIF